MSPCAESELQPPTALQVVLTRGGEGLTVILLHRASQPCKQVVRVNSYSGKACDGQLWTLQVRACASGYSKFQRPQTASLVACTCWPSCRHWSARGDRVRLHLPALGNMRAPDSPTPPAGGPHTDVRAESDAFYSLVTCGVGRHTKATRASYMPTPTPAGG